MRICRAAQRPPGGRAMAWDAPRGKPRGGLRPGIGMPASRSPDRQAPLAAGKRARCRPAGSDVRGWRRLAVSRSSGCRGRLPHAEPGLMNHDGAKRGSIRYALVYGSRLNERGSRQPSLSLNRHGGTRLRYSGTARRYSRWRDTSFRQCRSHSFPRDGRHSRRSGRQGRQTGRLTTSD